VNESNRRWVDLEREVFSGAAVMRGADVGAKLSVAHRLQTLAEDLQSALEREDEEPAQQADFTVPIEERRAPAGHLCGPLPHGIDKDPLAREWSGKVAKK
jgi:hypothetical protein